MAVTQYFLGGNTAAGFVSYYDGFCSGAEDFLWVIKGGPGCGKSSFMKTVGQAAQDAGLYVEYVLCSGDPASVDGVYFPALHMGYVDGTAPHTLEVATPGAAGLYLDLGQFYDYAALKKERRTIEALQSRYRALYRAAYEKLAAVSSGAAAPVISSGQPRRFLRAITCCGVFTPDAPTDAVQRVDEARLRALCAQPGAVLMQNPLFPARTEAVYFPAQARMYQAEQPELPELGEVTALLAQAKTLHDELEAVYNPHVDFPRVYALANSHALRLLREN